MLLLTANLAALTLAASAATAAADDAAPDVDRPVGRDIIITAPVRQSERDVLQGTSVLDGEKLDRELRPTIGETLARLPGVSATSFGPGASRPVLRGFQGDRVRVLTDGIGSFDAANSSVDHAVVIDPLLADRVEVLRGPVALLYGSSAVGGVVNVLDARIPRTVPAEGYRLNAIAGYGSAADQRNVAGSADVAVGPQFVVNVNGSYLKADDLRIGGRVLSRRAREAALAAGVEAGDQAGVEEPIDYVGPTRLRGRLPNSAIETWNAGIGGALITDGGSLGVAYSHYDSLYGIPLRYATTVGQEVEAPRIDVAQDRVDLRGEVKTGGGFLDAIRLRLGHADYRHYELEPDGEIGTTFLNKGTEGRLELVQTDKGGWSGASGVQYLDRKLRAIGEEAFLPPAETEQFGVFTLQQLTLGRFRAEGGARYERTGLDSRPPFGDDRYPRAKKRVDAFSGSLGASYAIGEETRIGLNASRTERAPSAEELFSNGNHAGTQSYELGNPNFRTEKSWGLEATFHAHSDRFSLDASAYHNWFDDFIYESQVPQGVCEAAAGPDADEILPCFAYSQSKARYWGFEVDASARLATIGGYAISADVVGDYVRATITGTGPAPRIPPLRLLGGIEAQGDRATGRVEVERVFKQDRIAAFETPTDGFTMVNASLSFRPFADNPRTAILVSANNLFDVDARRHASVLKDFAPLAGRDIRVSLRLAI
ncbi:TonB-dependent receptor domain-containing protein [Sphingomonas sp. TZW2008]|uniref:TonB-dependent receptor domain-containing protein n=1 Tax=Sphingomonas sp. TZW2008 TaxID=1917973 RepID=UPI000A26ED11|nr:TonB-dependent receptor [Sphingomonas sp. TZW2008]